MRFFLLVTLLLFSKIAQGQDTTNLVTISFENTDQKTAIKQLQEKTGLQFYYLDEWLKEEVVSGTYTNVPLETILDDLFKDTLLNYYILKEKEVVLTRNIIIYDELPERFFGEKKDSIIETQKKRRIAPIFYDKKQRSSKVKTPTVRIGKATKDNRDTYVLKGYARKANTGKPISNLAIVVEGKDLGTSTDQNGYYEIELPAGENILSTASLGIADSRKRVIIFNDGELDFNLDESLEVLDAVILESNRDQNVKDVVTGKEEVDVEASKNIPLVLGERDVLKVATALPGITTAGEGAAGLNVRGGKADQNLTLLDDVLIYNPQHFFGLFSALNPFTIGKVDIYKGAIPAEYGGRLSSVFDIKTKDPNTEKLEVEASLGPVTSNITVQTPVVKEKSGLMIGARGAYANWILRSLDDEALNNSEASFYDGIITYNHKINEKNNIKATGYYSRDDFSITSDSTYVYSNQAISLKWDHKFNDKHQGNVLLANSRYEFDINFDGETNDDFKLGYSVNETELKLKMDYNHSPKYKFNYGLSNKLYQVQPGSIEPDGDGSIITPLTIDKEKALESAAFISGKFDFTPKFSVNAGIRYSLYNALGEGSQRRYEENRPRNEGTVIDTIQYKNNEVIQTYDGLEARFSARYILWPNFSLKAGYSNTYQYIHTLSNNTTVSPIDTWKLSDLNIEPQRAQQISFGAFKNFNEGVYELSIEGFYKKLDNILDFKVGSQILLNENVETEVLQGEGKAYGVEFLLRKNSGKLNGWLSYTYSRSLIKLDSEFPEEVVNNGNFFPANYDKPHDISLVTNYKFTKRFSLSANFVYQTGRPVTFPVGQFTLNGSEFVVFSDRNRFRIPDFYRLDLGFNVEGNHKNKKLAHSFWTISIYNVLGRNNPFSVFFVAEDGEIKPLQSSIFSIPVPSITYNLKF
ncbi:TonB-dependent receptor [Aquimarina sp. D1M17]|uniref:TonB-dependent receptor domain-containing protein n=1 Tax=Aquimarina acroporae TaxID=2937283 RepID=UPI0020C11DD3|nr:TonB-dependent receptor [Aquimarina acroporae]MCK8523378.1 TonB-dependent receptor [Aquimarina acroporae]